VMMALVDSFLLGTGMRAPDTAWGLPGL
jgi:hypothetical protein